ncbi:MAG: DNA gyrase inhibitor YacG [Bacillota bacterium]
MRCPICKRPVEESERTKPETCYPFCSERCKLIDLGRWLGGKYQIPCEGEDAPEVRPPRRDEQDT